MAADARRLADRAGRRSLLNPLSYHRWPAKSQTAQACSSVAGAVSNPAPAMRRTPLRRVFSLSKPSARTAATSTGHQFVGGPASSLDAIAATMTSTVALRTCVEHEALCSSAAAHPVEKRKNDQRSDGKWRSETPGTDSAACAARKCGRLRASSKRLALGRAIESSVWSMRLPASSIRRSRLRFPGCPPSTAGTSATNGELGFWRKGHAHARCCRSPISAGTWIAGTAQLVSAGVAPVPHAPAGTDI